MPATTLPIVVGGDANAEIKWGQGPEGDIQAYSSEGKGEYMIGAFREKGRIKLTPPPMNQWKMQTSRPRKAEVKGRQIDVVAARPVRQVDCHIVKDSYMFATSDHDAVWQAVEIKREAGTKTYVRPRTAPRRVSTAPPMHGRLNQQKLRDMAVKHTKEYPSSAYKDPDAVRLAFSKARTSKLPEDWKAALRARAEAKKAWRGEKVEGAAKGDWGAFQALRRKRVSGW